MRGRHLEEGFRLLGMLGCIRSGIRFGRSRSSTSASKKPWQDDWTALDVTSNRLTCRLYVHVETPRVAGPH